MDSHLLRDEFFRVFRVFNADQQTANILHNLASAHIAVDQWELYLAEKLGLVYLNKLIAKGAHVLHLKSGEDL